MINEIVLAAAGAVLLVASFVALHSFKQREISCRTVAAFLIGAGGAWCVARAAHGVPVSPLDLVLPVGVALWVVSAGWRYRNQDIRELFQ